MKPPQEGLHLSWLIIPRMESEHAIEILNAAACNTRMITAHGIAMPQPITLVLRKMPMSRRCHPPKVPLAREILHEELHDPTEENTRSSALDL